MKRIKKIISLCVTMLVLVLGLASCDAKPNADGSYDKITKSLKIGFDGSGSFLNGGQESCTLAKNTDGDTANFTLGDNTTVTIRFYAIDTPESTGGVEKWGKSASKYTANRLSNAKGIILESIDKDGVKGADLDSNGSRYLGFVWYKDSEKGAYKNLNLELVENGYSPNNCVADCAYVKYFKQAEEFAESKQLHIWASDDVVDPNYSTKPAVVTMKQLHDNLTVAKVKSGECEYFHADGNDLTQGTGTKVRILKTYCKDVKLYTNAKGATTITYVFAQTIDGVEYTINVYAGYSSSNAARNVRVGIMYQITGTIQYYSGGFQISGIDYNNGTEGGDLVTIKTDEYANGICYYTFTSESNNGYYAANSYYSQVSVTEVVSTGDTTITIKGTATNALTGSKEFTFELPKNSYSSVKVGDSLSLTGLADTNGKIFVR